jgi:hypothetical protein
MTYLFIMLAGIAGITKNSLCPGRKPGSKLHAAAVCTSIRMDRPR